MVTKLQLSQLHVTGSIANDVRYTVAAVRPRTYSISPTTCIFQNATVCIQVIPAAATCIRAYEGCVRSYCSLHAGTHAACMPP